MKHDFRSEVNIGIQRVLAMSEFITTINFMLEFHKLLESITLAKLVSNVNRTGELMSNPIDLFMGFFVWDGFVNSILNCGICSPTFEGEEW